MATYIIVSIIAYLLGSISFSVIFSKKLAGFDVREKGSGNAGTTNMLRSVGKKAAILTLICDILKGAVAVFIALIVGRISKNCKRYRFKLISSISRNICCIRTYFSSILQVQRWKRCCYISRRTINNKLANRINLLGICININGINKICIIRLNSCCNTIPSTNSIHSWKLLSTRKLCNICYNNGCIGCIQP